MAMSGGTAKLVKTGYANYGSAGAINLYVYYKSSQSTETNTSTVKCGMYVTSPSSSYDIGVWNDFNGSYVGTTSLTFDGTMPNFAGTYWLVENKSFTVTHDDDGKGKATIYWKWGVNSPWGQMVNPSGSFTIDLPTIARASVPTLSASSVKMGNTLTITTNRKSSSFTHTLKCTFGGTTTTIATGVGSSYTWTVPDLASKCSGATSGTATITCITYSGSTNVGSKNVTVTLNVPDASKPTISPTTVTMGNAMTINSNRKSSAFTHTITYSFGSASGTIGTGVTTSISWSVPLSLATQIKSSTSGTGTITCKTFNGSVLVGTNTVSFTAKVPNNTTTQPSFTSDGFALTPTGDIPSAFDGLYIQGKTGVKASFTASSTHSTISSYKMTADCRTYTGNPATSIAFASSGSNTITGTVTDARGYYTKQSKTITVIYYSKPKIVPYTGERAIICARCKSDGTLSDDGMYLKIKCGRSYSKVVADGVQKNFSKIEYRVAATGGSYSSWVEVLGESDTGNFVDLALSGLVESTTTSYSIQLRVSDTMGEVDTKTYTVPTASTDFQLREGGGGASFGKYSEREGLEVSKDWPSYFYGDVYGKAYGIGKVYELPNGSDVNDLTEIGVYCIPSNSSAETMTNLPVSMAGRIVVSSSNGSGRYNGTWAYLLQEYTTFDGYYRFYRMIHTAGTADEWIYNNWWCHSSTHWQDLGLSSNVTAAGTSMGRTPYGCSYRVVDENHVYVAFNCSFEYTVDGGSIIVNSTSIPEKYRPTRNVYAFCATGGRYVSRIYVNTSGNVAIEWVQFLYDTSATGSHIGTWIDGYIDYWV